MGTPSIKVFNTLSMQKEPLTPLRPGEVGIYVCGPTVYSYAHIGNARTFTAFDVVVRYLRYRGFKVRYVRNVTDVDDKIIRAAAETHEPPELLAERFFQVFQEDARRLKLLEPDFSPKVTDHIPEIRSLIQKLLDGGFAYTSQGDVYFEVSRYPQYARLSGKKLEELQVGDRVQQGEAKRNPVDFALWKSAKPGEPFWEAPWGPGRPGWHIECSAMSEKYLGETFDLHGGALDLIFPHHENELAQSQAASGKPCAKVWMHANFLDLAGAKMSKSLGNVVRLRDALVRVDGETLRYFFLSTHYRNPISFVDKSLSDSELRLEYFYETLQKVSARIGAGGFAPGPLHDNPGRFLEAFETSMDDDFNCPGAMAALAGLFGSMNEWVEKPPTKDKALVGRTLVAMLEQARTMGGVLGIFADDPAQWLLHHRARAVLEKGINPERVEQLISARTQARANKDFGQADALREELKGLGVEVMDRASGTGWKVIT